jgi:hypothetical protein
VQLVQCLFHRRVAVPLHHSHVIKIRGDSYHSGRSAALA